VDDDTHTKDDVGSVDDEPASSACTRAGDGAAARSDPSKRSVSRIATHEEMKAINGTAERTLKATARIGKSRRRILPPCARAGGVSDEDSFCDHGSGYASFSYFRRRETTDLRRPDVIHSQPPKKKRNLEPLANGRHESSAARLRRAKNHFCFRRDHFLRNQRLLPPLEEPICLLTCERTLLLTLLTMILSTSSVAKFVGRTLYSTTINYGAPLFRTVVGWAWSNLSVPAMCCCAVAALLTVMYLIFLGKWYAKVGIFVGGVSYYLYLAWFVCDNLPIFHWHFLTMLCAWGFACHAIVEAATESVWDAAKLGARKVISSVLTLLRAAAGKIRRGPAARREVSSNMGATAPSSVSAPPVKAKKTKSKSKAKKVKATASVNATAPAPDVPAPVKDQQVVPAVPAKTFEAISARPTQALTASALAYVKARDAVISALGPVMEVVFTIVPIVDVLVEVLKLTAKAYNAVDSALDPVMEVVFTIVPIFDVLAEVLKLAAKVCQAVDSALDPVMEVVFTIVPIFDVLEVVAVAALKLAVVVAAALGKAAACVGKGAAWLIKIVFKAVVNAALKFLEKLFAPVLKVYAFLKFVFNTVRYILSLVR
jgi:hypothetical protein